MQAIFGSLIGWVVSGTGRRILVFVLGFLTVALNNKLGLNLNAEQLAAEIALALGYLIQSASKQASVAKTEQALVSAVSPDVSAQLLELMKAQSKVVKP